jgi:hypothetical protein
MHGNRDARHEFVGIDPRSGLLCPPQMRPTNSMPVIFASHSTPCDPIHECRSNFSIGFPSRLDPKPVFYRTRFSTALNFSNAPFIGRQVWKEPAFISGVSRMSIHIDLSALY